MSGMPDMTPQPPPAPADDAEIIRDIWKIATHSPIGHPNATGTAALVRYITRREAALRARIDFLEVSHTAEKLVAMEAVIAPLTTELAASVKRVAELEAHWKSLSIFVGIEGAKLSGLEGSNFDSGQEYAFRRVAIEMNAHKALAGGSDGG